MMGGKCDSFRPEMHNMLRGGIEKSVPLVFLMTLIVGIHYGQESRVA